VILVDANLLLYAHDRSSPVHEPTRRWFLGILDGSELVGFSWIAVLAFLRISTSPKIFQDPFSIEDAIKAVDYWFSQPVATLVDTGEHHWPILRDLLLRTGVKGGLVTDAHLAALAIEHDATLLTRDGDFTQFPRLRVVNPLA
jgi:toxin-antitoxin system PIN domain toxin